MTGLLAPGRRAATAAAPRLVTTPRWRTLRGALTMAVLGAATIAGIQLGVTAPLTSPVQPPVAQVVTAADGAGPIGIDPDQDGRGRAGVDRGPGAGGGGR